MSEDTTASRLPPGSDPRLKMDRDTLEDAAYTAMPQVGRASSTGDNLMLLGGFAGILLLGGVTFFTLGNHKPRPAAAPPPAQQQAMVQTPPPVASSALPPINPSLNPSPAPETPMTSPPPNPAMMAQPMPPQTQPPVDTSAVRAPALIIDNTQPAAPATPGAGGKEGRALNSNDQFLASQTSDVSLKAQKIGDPSKIVLQGTVIPAVLETALNSDLPGYTRAIVSRDVRSFDGSTVLIPRGSHLIGQYKSGLSSGETRAFIIWNRLIRPDGVSVSLASPSTDDLGQAGLAGKVDSHFAKRFGSAILLSVVNGLSGAIGNRSGSTVVIGTSSDAQGAIGQALSSDAKIPPTIKVPQGAPIQVFAARDLDFDLES